MGGAFRGPAGGHGSRPAAVDRNAALAERAALPAGDRGFQSNAGPVSPGETAA